MRYRKLGLTELNVSLLGFGASPLGDVFFRTNPEEGTQAVHHAIDEGVNLFDVSPYYGLTLAEERLGSALVGKRDSVILATKCGRYGDHIFDFSPRGVTSGLEGSLRRLRTDYVDLLQVHDIEFGDTEQVINETLPALRQLQKQGKARYIGITGYSLKTLLRVAAELPVDAMLSYCRYNLLVTDMDVALVPFARQHEIGLINASPLHMGMLTENGAPEWHPAEPAVHAASRRVEAICKAKGVSLPELAIRFCLAHPYVSSTLVGMATQRQVDENLRALNAVDDDELIAEIQAVIVPDQNAVWPSGREENYG
ncbi:aldo/keto reductase [Tunturibacter psychrotolerans]|uniref:Aldo/keto reductase n=1 Tax=Tunturiibacter psychrotolerans TaxID=3069686 RepID=A0AAU7ZK41_9BACT